jgi:hypothetical protein
MGQTKTIVADMNEAEIVLKKAVSGASGMSYGYVVNDKDVLTVYHNSGQPCYGEMRPYGSTHKDVQPERQAKVGKPGDLHSPFPQTGNPVLVAQSLYTKVQPGDTEATIDFLNAYLDPETSPWRDASKFGSIIMDGDRPAGIFYSSTDFNPTILVEGWMFFRGKLGTYGAKAWKELRDKFPETNTAELLLFWGLLTTYDSSTYYVQGNDYTLSTFLDPKLFLAGTPIIEGPTLHDRGAYDRPTLHDLFGHTKTSILAELKKQYPSLNSSYQITKAQLPEAFNAFQKVLAA